MRKNRATEETGTKVASVQKTKLGAASWELPKQQHWSGSPAQTLHSRLIFGRMNPGAPRAWEDLSDMVIQRHRDADECIRVLGCVHVRLHVYACACVCVGWWCMGVQVHVCVVHVEARG